VTRQCFAAAHDFVAIEAQNVGHSPPPSELWRKRHSLQACEHRLLDYSLPAEQLKSQNMASQLLPLELIDKCVGSRIWVIMKGDKGMLHIAPDRVCITY
jgi:hypothetical protein